MAENSLVRIDRKSSIESEPRTLNLGQIRFARESALYVMNTMTIEQAMRVFTDGLKAVESKEEGRDIDDREDEEEEVEELRKMGRFRDVLSAPF